MTRPLAPRARLWLCRLLTFHVVCLGWVFFRAPSVADATHVLGRLLHLGVGTGVNLVVVATIAAFIATQFVPVERWSSVDHGAGTLNCLFVVPGSREGEPSALRGRLGAWRS